MTPSEKLKEEKDKWYSLVLPMFFQNEKVQETYAEISSELSDDSIPRYIDLVMSEIEKKGFRANYTYPEIVETIREKKIKLLEEAVGEISIRATENIFKKIKKSKDNSIFVLDDFIFVLLARSNIKIAKEGFLSLFAENSNNVVFVDSSFKNAVEESSNENNDKSGLDAFTQMYYDIFKRPNTIRESVRVPVPEDIIKLTIL